MADCSQVFKQFEGRISITHTDTKFLRAARSAITQKIKDYFSKSCNGPKLKFLGQGSFTMGTVVKPLEGEFDIDVGVYLLDYPSWTSERPKVETVSSWLVNALENHTATAPINKRSCVRIVYKPKDQEKQISYHVDLPIYIEYLNFWDEKRIRIGITGETQWERKTDPVGFTWWFIQKCKNNAQDPKQLVRLVKYIKAWKEYKKGNWNFPSGVALTVLMAENYAPNSRDDISFHETVRRAYNDLDGVFWINSITKPVENHNDLLEKLTDGEKKKFLAEFEKLVDDGKLAIGEEDTDRSISIWTTHFDHRFMN